MLENCICGNKAKLGVDYDGNEVFLTVECTNPDCKKSMPICISTKTSEVGVIESGVLNSGIDKISSMWSVEIKLIRAGFKPGEIPTERLWTPSEGPKAGTDLSPGYIVVV